MRVLITGANGHLGRRLIARLAPEVQITATVRSAAARRVLEATGAAIRIVELDYNDGRALAEAAADCDCAVHLVGILKETATQPVSRRARTRHRRAGGRGGARRRCDASCTSAFSVPIRVRRTRRSRRKAARNETLLKAAMPAVILRVPMVLGEDDYAAYALSRKASAGTAFLIARRQSRATDLCRRRGRRHRCRAEVAGTGTRSDRSRGTGVVVARGAGQTRRRGDRSPRASACRCRSRRCSASRGSRNTRWRTRRSPRRCSTCSTTTIASIRRLPPRNWVSDSPVSMRCYAAASAAGRAPYAADSHSNGATSA